MKITFLFAILTAGLLLKHYEISAQVAIGSTTPDASSLLDLNSNSKGLLIPRLTFAERNVMSNPATGLIIFQTDSTPGLYYNSGTPASPLWGLVGNNAGQWQTSGSNIYYTLGNVGIGTTNPTAKLQVAGGDALINGLTIGSGAGSISSNLAVGSSVLALNSGGNLNTGVGASALHSNTTGSENTGVGAYALTFSQTGTWNTAVGSYALHANQTGHTNVGIGAYALSSNLASNNTAVGHWTLESNTYARNNIAIGTYALSDQSFSNSNSAYDANNIAIGYEALTNNNPTAVTNGIKNHAIGYRSLYSNTTGFGNVAIGYASLFSNTEGYSNTAIGNYALYHNTVIHELVAVGDSSLHNNGSGATGNIQAHFNTAIGSKALYANTTGYSNMAAGYKALTSNTSGHNNSACGYLALNDNTTGIDNTAFGYDALLYNTTGDGNVAVGSSTLWNNLTGERNVAVGTMALSQNKVSDNVALGEEALEYNTYSSKNIAIGSYALNQGGVFINGNTSYNANNIAIGFEAMYITNPTATDNGINNNAMGYRSLYLNTTGYGNTAIGHGTMYANTTGYYNVAVGASALNDLSTGNSNTAVGINAGPTSSYPNVSNTTALGNYTAVTASDQVRIGNSSVTSIGGYQTWTTLPSDGKYKTDVQENVAGLDFILKLRPVTYHLDIYKLARDLEEDRDNDDYGKSRTRQFSDPEIQSRNEKAAVVYSGFIAQEVETAARSVDYDFSGIDAPKNAAGFYGLRYAEFVVPLVKAIQELKAENDALKARLDALETRLPKE